MILKKGDLFITVEDEDLVTLINLIRDCDFKIGEDVGVISYNETPLKELLGITVISTAFQQLKKSHWHYPKQVKVGLKINSA